MKKYEIELPTEGHSERVEWLLLHHGDRDPQLKRWQHHLRKGENRSHWDRKAVWDRQRAWSNHDLHKTLPECICYIFTHRDVALMFKLRWGGQT